MQNREKQYESYVILLVKSYKCNVTCNVTVTVCNALESSYIYFSIEK